MEIKDVLKLLNVSPIAGYKCQKGIECNFYIQIYSQSEWEEIVLKIQEELKMFSKVNGNMLTYIKEKYRISSKDMRNILGSNYATYYKIERRNEYVKLELQEKRKRSDLVISKWKNKDTITCKSIHNIMRENQYNYKEIRELFGISKKDIQLIETNQKKKVKINVHSNKDIQECWQKVDNEKKYNLSKKKLEQIAKEKKMTTQKVAQILNIKPDRMNKLMKQEQLTVKIYDEELRKKVEKIALDLKYLPNNGERYYQQDEINFMSVFYKVSVKDMFYYLANGKTEYNTYIEAFHHNPKGVWLIGRKIPLTNAYEEAHHKFFDYYFSKIAENIRVEYNCNFADREDFKSEAFEYILRNGGFYEKNLYHNPEQLNCTLIKNVAFVMRSYYAKKPKELALTIVYKGEEYENEELLADNRYNPEICYLEETYSYLKEIEETHSNIVKEIQRNIWFAIDYPKKFFSRIARKNNMTEDEMAQKREEIMTFIIKNKLVKVTKDGKVIPRFFVEEDE